MVLIVAAKTGWGYQETINMPLTDLLWWYDGIEKIHRIKNE
jgi:hypothetical protein